jgi:hypothetical protein
MNWSMNEDCAGVGKKRKNGLGYLGAKCNKSQILEGLNQMFESSFFQSSLKFVTARKVCSRCFEAW